MPHPPSRTGPLARGTGAEDTTLCRSSEHAHASRSALRPTPPTTNNHNTPHHDHTTQHNGHVSHNRNLATEARRRRQRVRSDDAIQIRLIHRPYGCQFTHHPSRIRLTGPLLSYSYNVVSQHADPYTGKSASVMREGQEWRPELPRRKPILESIMQERRVLGRRLLPITLNNLIWAVGGGARNSNKRSLAQRL